MLFGKSKEKEERLYSVMTTPGGTIFNSYDTEILSIPAVYACITLVSETVSALPLEAKLNGFKAPQHPGAKSMLEPYENMTFNNWISTIIRNLYIWGNAYAWIKGANLVIIDHISLIIKMDSKGLILYYEYTNENQVTTRILKEDILHFKRTTKDERGQVGLGLTELFADLFGEIKETSNHIKGYLETGLLSGLWLEIPGRVQQDTLDKIRQKFKGLYQGVKNRSAIPTLTDGMKLNELKQTPLKDSNIDQLKLAQLKEIAMLFNIPVTMLDGSLGNYGSTVEANLMFTKICINPLLKILESEMNLKLNYGSDLTYYFDTAGYLAGTFNQQIETLARSVDAGILTPNEARGRIGYKEIKGGDNLYAPAGTPGTGAGEITKPPGTKTAPKKEAL